MSHSINPYSEGTAAQLKEQLASLALSGDAGQNQYFEDTAAMILERVFPALVNMRDKGLINLDIQTIGRALPLGGLYELTVNPDVEPLYQRYIHDHLASIGFDFDNPKKINPEISKQHSQFISHFFKIIASFSIQYRHIFMCDQGDINIKDIMLNRRTHITSLPSLEKSGAELKNLGSIILTGHKMGASASLGDQMEGTAEETLGGLSSSYDVPYALTYDEWAFYAIKDIALLPAQARSIRYCIMFFAQDYAGTERAGEMDAEQVFANTIVKLFGSMQESGKTWQKIRELIGEVKMAVSSKYKYIPGIFGGRYISDPESTEITHRTEVEAKEFQQQREGEFFTFIRGVLSPIKVFYMDLGGWQKRSEKVSGNAFELVRLCKVYRPTTQEKEQILLHERREILLYSHDTLFNKKGFVDELFQNSEAVTSTRAYIDKLNQLANNNALRLGIPSNALTNNNPPKIKTSKPKIETLKQDKPSEATSLPVSNDIEKNTSENDIETDTLSGSGGVISQFSQPNIPENNSLEVTVPQTNEPIETEPNITPVATKKRMSESGNLTQANQDNIDAKIQLKDNFQSLAQETQASREKIQQSISNNQLEEGALLFSSTQKSLLLKDMSTISNLLGYEKEKSDTIAKRIVNKLSSNYYYLAPPRPTQLEKQDIESIESRVKKLLN